MALYYCGFNGFQQILNSDKIIPKLTEIELKCLAGFNEITDVDIYMHWSYSIIKINKTLYRLGYCPRADKLVNKILPQNEFKEVKQIVCDEDQLLLLNTSGSLFKFTDETSFSRIDNLHHVESNALTEELVKPCDSIKVTHLSGSGKCFTALIAEGHHFYVGLTKIFTFDEDVVDLSCGFKHVLILTAEGNVYSWGHGSRGQLGHGELSNEDSPRLIEALAGIKITAISAGGWHSCAVGSLGDLYAWGSNDKGQLGLPVAGFARVAPCHAPVPITAETETYNILAIPKLINFLDETFEVLKISCGNAHTIIYGNDMNLYGAGWNKYKQTGINTDDIDIVSQFCKIEPGLKFGANVILKCGPWSTSVILR